jgi:long-chain acyl-CoA synthetase
MLLLNRADATFAPESGQPSPLAESGSLCGLLLERARLTPKRPAYRHFDKTLGRWVDFSWAQTLAEVGRWQRALDRERLSPGDRVAILMSNRPEWVRFDLAALGLGLATVPLYANDRPESVRHMLEDSGARLLLVETSAMLRELAPIAEALRRLQRVLVLESDTGEDPVGSIAIADWLGTESASAPPEDRVGSRHTLATVVYTSGTTGPAKGAMLTHGNLLWNAEASLRRVPARPSDRFLSFLPLSHTLERTAGYYLPLMAGACVAYARSVATLGEDLATVRPTVLIGVPRIFERLHGKLRERLESGPPARRRLFERAVAVGWRAFLHRQGRGPWDAELLIAPLLDRLVGARVRARLGGRLRIAVCGGAPLPPEIGRTLVALGLPILQGYGLTEASPVISVNTLSDNRPETVGPPLPDVEARIDPHGELLVRSPGVMRGYWGRPDATAAAIDRMGWLHTGDQARIDDGHLTIVGRLKDTLVLSTGEKVPPSDLESAILGDGLFAQALLVGESKPFLGLLAVLEPDAFARLAAAEGLPPDIAQAKADPRLEPILLGRIQARLAHFPSFALIRRVVPVERAWSVEDGLMTPTMKLRRARILSHYASELDLMYRGH